MTSDDREDILIATEEVWRTDEFYKGSLLQHAVGANGSKVKFHSQFFCSCSRYGSLKGTVSAVA